MASKRLARLKPKDNSRWAYMGGRADAEKESQEHILRDRIRPKILKKVQFLELKRNGSTL